MHRLDEQETNFTVEATDRTVVHVFSNDPVWQKRLEALGITPYSEDDYGKLYRVSLENFSFGIRHKRQLTYEQRVAAADRLNAVRPQSTGAQSELDSTERIAA